MTTTRTISQRAVVAMWISRHRRSRQAAALHLLVRKSGRPKLTLLAMPPACIPSRPWAFGWTECTYFIYKYLQQYTIISHRIFLVFGLCCFQLFFYKKNNVFKYTNKVTISTFTHPNTSTIIYHAFVLAAFPYSLVIIK